MAVQISRRIHPEMPKKAVIRGGEEEIGTGVSSTGRTEGMSDRGGAHHAGSRSHAHKHTAEVGGFECGGLYQGQECDPCGLAFLEAREELRGPEPLGVRVLRGHGGSGYRGHPALHPKSGRRRSKNGPT